MPELHDEDRTQAAHLLGMKESEIVAVVGIDRGGDTGAVVETHDGQRLLIEPDGTVCPWEGPMPTDEEDVVLFDDEGMGEDEVPEGTAETVLAWAGDDQDRASRALVAEQAGQNRSTLVAKLEKLANA